MKPMVCVTLTIADTTRLMDVGTTLEKLGQELELPKIDIEGMGYEGPHGRAVGKRPCPI